MMKISASSSSLPLKSPLDDTLKNLSVEEAHALATNPDFQVKESQARKLGVHTFKQARRILAQPLLTDENIVTLFRIARTHLLWILGPSSPFLSQVAAKLCNDQLAHHSNGVSERYFRSQMTLLVQSTASLLKPTEAEKLNNEVAQIVSNATNVQEAAANIFRVIFPALIPKWEERATRDVHERQDQFAEGASNKERAHLAQMSYEPYLEGRIATWIDQVIATPHEHGLKGSPFENCYFSYLIQGALLMDIASHEKDIDPDLLPLSLTYDKAHLLELQKTFNNLLKALCIVDFYAVLRPKLNKDEAIKNVLIALKEGDQSLGLSLSDTERVRLGDLMAQRPNAVANIHRKRLKDLFVESLAKTSLPAADLEKWRYKGISDELTNLRKHFDAILRVHSRVFGGLYQALIESHLEKSVCSSLFSNNNDRGFLNWLNETEQQQALQLKYDMNAIVASLAPVTKPNQQTALRDALKDWTTGGAWDDVKNLLTQNITTAQCEQLNTLGKNLNAFIMTFRKRRNQTRQESKDYRVPLRLHSGR